MKRTGLFLLLLALFPLTATARDLTGEVEVSSFGSFDRVASMNGRGEVLVVWQDGITVNGRLFAPDNTPRGPAFEVSEPTSNYITYPSASLDSRGFSVVWGQESRFSFSSWMRRFDATGEPVTDQFAVGTGPAVDSDPRGNSVVVSLGSGKILGQRYDAAGRPAGQPILVAESRAGLPLQVAVDGRGNFVVVWKTDKSELLGRRFEAGGQPRGPVFQIAASAGLFDLAGNGQGSFVVIWTSPRGLRARVYRPTGEVSRGTLLVAPRITDPQTLKVSVAMDAAGRFLATWECCRSTPVLPSEVFGRFFEASGLPIDRPFQVGLRAPGQDFIPDAAGGPAGEFFVVWSRTDEDGFSPLIGRRLQWARRGDDLCRFAGGGFACDLTHDGAPPAVTVSFGQPGDQPLFGDLDGDGRDDYCVYRNGRFLCDTAHDGGGAEVDLAFGLGGIALLGDLDGDGRDDPCSRQADLVLCDTAHDGGTAEVVVRFGTSLDATFLADEDGDGDDDVCISRGGFLLCDTGEDGGTAEARIRFRLESGDRPLLGDVDDDGRDDPCVVRRQRLLCDTAHEGRFTKSYPFALGAGEIPVLGDVNGI